MFTGIAFGAAAGATSRRAAGEASHASSQARAASRNVHQLEERLERLSLVCMAMWSLIQDKTNLTEEDLMERVKTIDLMDGEADGKANRSVSECRECRRVMSPRHQHCIYCGAARLKRSAFDAV